MASTTTTFNVGMTCEGCSNAIRRILGKMEGITSIETDLEAKKVVVVHAEDKVKASDILAALEKWGEAAGKDVALA
ncbi:copper chaperone [Nannochloropsis oceanica]